MQIILKQARENGGRPGLQSWSRPEPPEGYAIIPDGFNTSVFYAYMGFVSIEVKDDVLVSMTGNQEAFDAYKAANPEPVVTEPTAAEKREQAYETGSVDGDETDYRVEWDGKLYTIDALTQLGVQYRFRGETETADAIQAITVAGVEAIRAAYPDEE